MSSRWRKFFDIKTNFRSLYVPPPNHIEALDGWRALAMLWIMFQHAILMASFFMPKATATELSTNPIYRPLMHAQFAVDIFFVVSGFLIGGILIRDHDKSGKINFKRFYTRRALRMFPIYYFVLVFAIIAHLGWNPLGPEATKIWPSFFYLNNFVGVRHQMMGWTWSLAIDEQFYLVCPLLVWGAFRLRLGFVKVFLALIVGTLVCQWFLLASSAGALFWQPLPAYDLDRFSVYYDLIFDKPYVRFGSLFVGVLGAYAHHRKLDRLFFTSRSRAWLSLATAMGLCTAIMINTNYIPGHESSNKLFLEFQRVLFSVAAMLLIFGSFHVEWFRKIFSIRIFHPLFQLSYGGYLTHSLIAEAVLKKYLWFFFPDVIPNLWQVSRFAILIAASGLAAAVPLYLFIEKPFMNLRR
jgi:peptidoglycan/LPS O-acetylase OafA/YrhL